MILAVAVLKGFKNEIIEKQRGFSGDVIAFQYDLNIAYDNMPISLSDTATTELKAIDNVKSIYPFATKPGIINVNDEVEGVVLKGIDARYDQSYLAEILVEGKGIDFSDANAANTQILVSQTLANRLSLSLGDDFLM